MLPFDLQLNGYKGVDFNGDSLSAADLRRACEAVRADGGGLPDDDTPDVVELASDCAPETAACANTVAGAVAALGGLQSSREFEAVRRHHAVIVVPCRDQRRRIASAGSQVVKRRVFKEDSEVFGILRVAVV